MEATCKLRSLRLQALEVYVAQVYGGEVAIAECRVYFRYHSRSSMEEEV